MHQVPGNGLYVKRWQTIQGGLEKVRPEAGKPLNVAARKEERRAYIWVAAVRQIQNKFLVYIEAEGKRGRNIGQVPIITNMKMNTIEKELSDIEEVEANFPPCFVR